MGICACNNKASDVPHSELFVPRFDVTVDKVHQKKLLRLKSLALNKNEVIPLKTVSTEKYIYSKELIKPGAITKNTTFNPDISMLNKLHFLQTDKAPIINIVSRHSSYRENMPNFKLEPPKVKQEDKHCSVIVPSPPKEIFEKKESAENNNIQCEISEQIFSNTEEIFIANVLLRHYLFNQVTQEQISSLISEINEYQIEENNYLFYEEEKASCVYIIKSGKVELSNKNSNKTIVLSQGSVFGEIALFSDTSLRQYSAKSITKVELFLIDNNTVAPFLSGMKIKPTFHFHLFDYLDTSIRDKLAFFSSGIDCLKGKFISELNGILGIESGELSVYEIKTNKEIEVYRKGDIIGMKKLLLNPDDCTSVIKTNYQFGNNVRIVAKENTKCSLIPILTFVEILGLEYSFKILFGVFNTIMVKNFFFLNMSSSNDGSELKKLYPLFELKEYTKNDIIYNKEAYKTNKTIQIIIEGSASYIYNDTNKGNVNDNGKQSIKVGCIIGEECVSGIRLFSDIKVKTEKMLLLESSWNECKENINVLNSTLTKFIKRMNDMFLFSRLPEWKIIKLYKHCQYKTYNNGDKIIALNKKIDKVFFIKSGSVKYKVDKKTIRKYYKGNSFGELFLLNGKEAKSELIASEPKTKIYSIDKECFIELMSDSRLNLITKKKLCNEDIEIFPSSLFYISTLNRGSYSNIYMVHNKISLYVVKGISIIDLNKSHSNDKVVTRILNEKKAAKRLNHPFIVKYVKTIKNYNWCFFIEEYIHGITLQEYIEMCKPNFDLKIVKFYAGCLFIILDVLKSYGIIHRDIKPENIMIDTDGYIKLIDFSSCKRIKTGVTKTFIGTPFFIAPEVLSGKGYGYSCDYWSVGIILYYLYYGEYPFGDQNINVSSIYKQILNKKLVFKKIEENNLEEKDFIELIDHLLERDVYLRSCSLKQIKTLNIFKDFDWTSLQHKKMPAPFIPQVVKLTEDKMLNNVSSPFMSFIEQDSTEKKVTTIIDFKNSNKNNFRYDKDVVMSTFEEKENRKTDIIVKNWFDEF